MVTLAFHLLEAEAELVIIGKTGVICPTGAHAVTITLKPKGLRDKVLCDQVRSMAARPHLNSLKGLTIRL
jgi:hypothetical protein